MRALRVRNVRYAEFAEFRLHRVVLRNARVCGSYHTSSLPCSCGGRERVDSTQRPARRRSPVSALAPRGIGALERSLGPSAQAVGLAACRSHRSARVSARWLCPRARADVLSRAVVLLVRWSFVLLTCSNVEPRSPVRALNPQCVREIPTPRFLDPRIPLASIEAHGRASSVGRPIGPALGNARARAAGSRAPRTKLARL